MNILPENFRIFVKPGVTDMRKSINTLGILVQSDMELEMYTGDLFVFCNRKRDILKILYWHKTGFALWQKRLEKARFPWPKDENAVMELDNSSLEMLLNGIDFFNAHKELTFSA